jgi:flagellar protein FlaG
MSDLKVVSTEFGVKQDITAMPKRMASQESVGSAPELNKVTQVTEQALERTEKSAESVEQAVASLNEYAQSVERDLKFQLDDQSGKTIITVYDGSTEEVVRQIPDDVVLRLARDLQQDQPISLFKAKV